MIPAEFDYVAPGSLDEALAALSDGGEDAKVLAGGHSLIPLMKLRLAAPSLLVDLRRRRGAARASRATTACSRFGAMVRHHDVATGGFGLPSAAAATIADQQVRNMGTIGGTLAHGDPASDLPAILLAHEGTVIIRGARRRARGRRGGLLRGLPHDRGRRGRDPHRGPAAGDGRATATATRSSTAARRTGRWWPSRALVKKGGDGTLRRRARSGSRTWARCRCGRPRSEDALRGQPLTADTIAAAAEQAAEGTEPPADLNASQDYKRHLARVLSRRALTAASQ